VNLDRFRKSQQPTTVTLPTYLKPDFLISLDACFSIMPDAEARLEAYRDLVAFMGKARDAAELRRAQRAMAQVTRKKRHGLHLVASQDSIPDAREGGAIRELADQIDESRDTFNEAMIRTLEGQRRTNTPNEPEVA
jgi:hypothetical protein